jgi:GAF domain-containing protein
VDIAPKLIALAAALSDDDGKVLLLCLEEVLGELAPFEVGEIAVRVHGRLLRSPLGRLDGNLLDAGLERRLSHLRAPLRIDDLADAPETPEAAALCQRLGLRSLLAFPLFEGETRLGLLVLCRRETWGFVTVSLRAATPVAQMAGICLARARGFTRRPK